LRRAAEKTPTRWRYELSPNFEFEILRDGHDGVPGVNQKEQELAAGFPLDVERKARRCCTITSNERRSLRPVCRNVQLKLLIAAIRNADSVRETRVPIPWYSNYLRLDFVGGSRNAAPALCGDARGAAII
jgi:hypothetical protein